MLFLSISRSQPSSATWPTEYKRIQKVTVYPRVGFDKLSPRGSDLFVSRKFEISEQVFKIRENPPNPCHPRSILVGLRQRSARQLPILSVGSANKVIKKRVGSTHCFQPAYSQSTTPFCIWANPLATQLLQPPDHSHSVQTLLASTSLRPWLAAR